MTTAQTRKLDDHVRGLLRLWLISPGLSHDDSNDLRLQLAARWWIDRASEEEQLAWQMAWSIDSLDLLARLESNDSDLNAITRVTVALYGSEA